MSAILPPYTASHVADKAQLIIDDVVASLDRELREISVDINGSHGRPVSFLDDWL